MVENVLVTGATGALGPAVLSRLLGVYPHASVTVLGRTALRDAPPGVRFLHADLRRPDLGDSSLRAEVAAVTHVIHMAAEIRWNQDLATSRDVNVGGTTRLIDLLRAASPRLRRFVFVSTA